MSPKPALILGSTGPSGLCLVRELLNRSHPLILYIRPQSISKIPQDLASSPLLQIITGQLDDDTSLSPAISQCGSIVSLIGPSQSEMSSKTPLPYPDYYQNHIIPLMKKHGVKRIAAMATVSIYVDEDVSKFTRWLMVTGVSWGFPAAYNSMLGIAKVFKEENDEGIQWTVFRLPMLMGGSDEETWKQDRERGAALAGPVSDLWSGKVNRSLLGKWLADWVEKGEGQWVRQFPAISS
ncbi:hypothetical protein QBC38DRAFT_365024 [Podospora fimiseda]|uniref:NAD(P)-binding domain-containing protein n=1 Tax=Podospora fimiseda TaxID=252190 RepID=A0AAN7BPC8_9PEZI|nr:hypothetical protein QBC38DRAFT_365024 [Podospora fimiseda]